MTNDRITRDYRCARCWGGLVEKFIGGKFVVVCAADAEHEGIVTDTWVEYRRTLDRLESAEVGSQYAGMLGLSRPNLKAASQALYGDDERIG